MSESVIAIVGVPGVGKTALMQSYLATLAEEWKPFQCGLIRGREYTTLSLHVLGKYQDGEIFAGTDRLSMAMQRDVPAYFRYFHGSILAEGARVTTHPFFNCALAAGKQVVLIELVGDLSTIAQRRTARSQQKATWVKGQTTRIHHVIRAFMYRVLFYRWDNTTPEALAHNIEQLQEVLRALA